MLINAHVCMLLTGELYSLYYINCNVTVLWESQIIVNALL